MSISNVIKSVQDIMRQDAGVDGDAQRISQLVWMIFLKVFDAKEEEWELEYDDYESVIPEELRWSSWAADDEGITGDELLEFINNRLFKELKEMELGVDSDPKAFFVKAVFEDSYNYMKSGALIRQVINKLNEIDFTASEDRHLFNDIYENILKDLQSAGNSGEFYTPRPVTQFIIDMLDPKLGEKVADFACGTGGFLTCAIEHLKKQQKSVDDIKVLGETIIGVEKKPLPHLLATTNLILHDIDVPNISHDNSLTKNVRDLKESDYVDVIAMNPPFGGVEEDSVLTNFPNAFQTKETADLFMTVMMYRLSDKGRAGVVLPDGFLFGEGVKTKIKEKLLSEFNLHTIVRLPQGVFAPYTDINTNLLFFEKCGPTKEIWFFEHPLPIGYKKYTKTKPIRINEFELEQKWWNNRVENEYAWKVSIDEIKDRNYNLDIKNPYIEEVEDEYTLEELLNKFKKNQIEIDNLFEIINKELSI
ncbi:N-6 DNA methylase [Paeniclostridium sordellii]|uniref:type I restriction-modification system subunit M n=1 Tax=Paraclostridium sordellii TaxID=1505 RepID=UPI0005E27FE3|nr:class I SAM-dependent DNA methyltransferase [Paeniclostridium sordellii]MDU4412810.1 class I SAM-dependent DNA methyltransferase [Paeniclostridium sordellii]MRZ29585.1 N-6 DNA methylase [Paeniclostridium sordellii]MVO73649.1 N-6 DNA methylase [Paeniclostridium sordellii]CEQ06458.1 type I restriction enzyme EcoEI M protein HsdM [[Clostridium] sordellii] [Paeniclostridium sordellii]